MRTSQRALENSQTGEESRWRNPDNGHSGSVTPIRTLNEHGRFCREYSNKVTIGGKTQEAYGKACRQPDGSWQIVQE
jgi:surface antigen